MNVPRKPTTEAINSHGEPCIIMMIPQPMKKANSKKTKMDAINFIGLHCSETHSTRKTGRNAVAGDSRVCFCGGQ